MRRYSDTAVLKPLELSNDCLFVNTRGRWLQIALNDVTYPFTIVLWMSPQLKLGRQGQLQHTSLFKVFFFIPENQLPVSVKVLFSVHFIWLLFFQKETWVPKFPRSVTPCQSFRQSDIFQKLNKERTYTIQTTTFCLGTARRSRRDLLIPRPTLDLRWAQNTDPSSLIIVMIAIPQYFPCAVSHTEWMENPSIESYLLQLLN